MPFLSGRSSPTTRTASYGSHTDTTTTAPLSPQQQQQYHHQHQHQHQPLRNVRISDDELLSRLHQCDSALALQTALSDPLSSWDSRRRTSCLSLSAAARREPFELSTRCKRNAKAQHLHSRPSASTAPMATTSSNFEVLAVGCIACSPQELVAVLGPATEPAYNSAMNAVYGRRFIYGSLVHALDRTRHSGRDRPHVTVKTACFARSSVLARNEQWCFLDAFQRTTSSSTSSALAAADASSSSSTCSDPTASPSKGFAIQRLSLSPRDVVRGKAAGGRVQHVEHLSTLVVVDTVPAVSKDVSDGTSTKLRVTFYASTASPPPPPHDVPRDARSASARTTRARAVAIARGIARLPAVVRRRRLGVQVFAAASVVPQTPVRATAHCVACTKGLRLRACVRRARRCHLCAYSVCRSCWSRELMETSSGHVVARGVCARCLEWVDRCDYSNACDGPRGPVRIVDDAPARSRPVRGRRFEADLAAEATRAAAVTVIKLLLERDNATTTAAADGNGQDAPSDYLSAVDAYFARRATDAPRAEDCVLANAVERRYAVQPADGQVGSPPAPIPANERARLEGIARWGLLHWREPLPELDLICAFLRREMGFFCVMVTIVGATHQLVLSCTMEALAHALLPRGHTFCQHLVMGTAPFIVRHPEADIRFYNLNPVKLQGVKYYCGVPVVGLDELVVGSICCVHSSAMDITRMQYDTLVRFGEIASRVIRTKAEALQQTSWEGA